MLTTYYTFIVPFKLLNQKHNGEFVITNRGPWVFYGATVKRLQKLNTRMILVGLAQSAGDHFLFECF